MHLGSDRVIADNIYYKSGSENIKFIVRFACYCVEWKLRTFGIDTKEFDSKLLVDRFSLTKDLDEFMNSVVCGKAISEFVNIQSY